MRSMDERQQPRRSRWTEAILLNLAASAIWGLLSLVDGPDLPAGKSLPQAVYEFLGGQRFLIGIVFLLPFGVVFGFISQVGESLGRKVVASIGSYLLAIVSIMLLILILGGTVNVVRGDNLLSPVGPRLVREFP